jgi:peptidoglycan hydrolase-like protein with peptidoglycan-binding domain
MNERVPGASENIVTMKKLLSFIVVSVALSLVVRGDDRLRDVQAELKTQGFYYGEVNGQNGNETSAAIRRYQIRNGLEVTGSLTDETIRSLGIGVAPIPQIPPEPAAPVPPRTAPPQAPQHFRRDAVPLEEADRDFLRQEEAKQRGAEPAAPLEDDPAVVPAPRPQEAPSPEFPVLFADTPYANAPFEVQEATLRRAQTFLASRGIYREAVDGAPGPATEEALLSYQRSARLPLTGRLDLDTLSTMRLLPGHSPAQAGGFIPPQRQTANPPIYRGIWIR